MITWKVLCLYRNGCNWYVACNSVTALSCPSTDRIGNIFTWSPLQKLFSCGYTTLFVNKSITEPSFSIAPLWSSAIRQFKVRVKCTLVQALRLSTGHTAHRGSRGLALLFLDHGTRRGLGVSVTPRPLFTPRKDPVPIVQEAEWAPGTVWTGAENLAPYGIRSPDRPASSQSLNRLNYPAYNKAV